MLKSIFNVLNSKFKNKNKKEQGKEGGEGEVGRVVEGYFVWEKKVFGNKNELNFQIKNFV